MCKSCSCCESRLDFYARIVIWGQSGPSEQALTPMPVIVGSSCIHPRGSNKTKGDGWMDGWMLPRVVAGERQNTRRWSNGMELNAGGSGFVFRAEYMWCRVPPLSFLRWGLLEAMRPIHHVPASSHSRIILSSSRGLPRTHTPLKQTLLLWPFRVSTWQLGTSKG